MATTNRLTGLDNTKPVTRLPVIRRGTAPMVERIVTPAAFDISVLSPEIVQMANEAKEHYARLGAENVYQHAVNVLKAAIRGKLLLPSTNGADPFSKAVAELILYHAFDSEANLPSAQFSPGFETRFALHKRFKQLDSQAGERSEDYTALLCDKSTDPTELLIVLSTRIADMMTMHDPATLAAASTKMPGVFPIHENWESVKKAWAWPMLYVYCGIADWGGQTRAYREMRDNAVQYLYPEEYRSVLRDAGRFEKPVALTNTILEDAICRVSQKMGVRVLLADTYSAVSTAFEQLDPRTIAIARKPFKGFGGLLKKSIERGIPLELVHDWVGATAITYNESLMYDVATFLYEEGIRASMLNAGIREFFTLPIKDYVTCPKPVTLYESLHEDTVSRHPGVVPLEVILRTMDMHIKADEGTAGHDVYKLRPLRNGERRTLMQRLNEITTRFQGQYFVREQDEVLYRLAA